MKRKSYFAAIGALAAHCLVLSSFVFAQAAPDPAGRGGSGTGLLAGRRAERAPEGGGYS